MKFSAKADGLGMHLRVLFTAVCGMAVQVGVISPAMAVVNTPNPVLFVTQTPVGGFGSGTTVFGNHYPGLEQMPRGGDLVLRYPDGTLRFLTAEAGYGNAGMQGANSIAVREPCVHWNGQKALFSMVVGASTQQYQYSTWHWQIYEVTGLGVGQTAVIQKIANQPNYNNVSPIYATDGRILFTSDRPATGAAHHYPQRDEYESAPIVAGIYSLNPASGDLKLLEHAPSGATSLSLDSFGRVIFTKWDHLQRDQQADAPATAATYKAFTFASEAANAATTTSLVGAEVFPEPRTDDDPAYSPTLELHSFNHFFPWEMNQDGTAEETLNHVGRHELGGAYTEGSFVGDNNLTYYVSPSLHANQVRITGSAGLFHLREDPANPGDFLMTYAQEFGTASGGTLMRITGDPTINPEAMVMTKVTPGSEDAAVPQSTGYFRNPLPLTDGTLVSVHTPATGYVSNLGSTTNPNWSYYFRLKQLQQSGNFFAAGQNLTNGISKSLTWWTPDALATYNGPLWELDPVEVFVRPVPTPRVSDVPVIEAGVFAEEGVDIEEFQEFLRLNNLALIVSRNVTQRDRADKQQPFNLKIPGGVSSIAAGGAQYDVSRLQIYQGDYLRGYGNPGSPNPGRRILPRPMHEPGTSQAPGAPQGAVAISPDGSFAALVPARRALTWQLTGPDNTGVVRERNWISFQSGEIRVCTSCHGLNTKSQTGALPPQNEPEALHDLLVQWKANGGGGGTPLPTATPTPTAMGGGADDCTSGIVLNRARLRARAMPFTVALAGEAVVPKPWQAVNPSVNGVRVVIEGILDAAIPGGAGWVAKGTKNTFTDKSGAHGGITKITINDLSKRVPGKLSIKVRGGGGSQSLPGGAARAWVVFGSDSECATAQWSAPGNARPSCQGASEMMSCH